MTARLADVRARVEGVRQLGSVVNAMRGIAAARAQAARNQLAAVDSYATIIAAAIGRTLAMSPPRRADPRRERTRKGLVAFCAEQGFAGAFSERVLDALGGEAADCELFLIGTRGADIVAQRNLSPSWTGAAPSHSSGAPKLADRISVALYQRIASGKFTRLDAVYTVWEAGRGFRVERHRLLPLDLSAFASVIDGAGPLSNLPPENLLTNLAGDYLHAQLCQATLHSFAAENQARMEAMAAARRQVDKMLGELRATERRVRQDEITDEIVELSAGESAARKIG